MQSRNFRAPRWRARFLRALAETGTVRLACRFAHISKTPAYALRRRDAAFAHAWDEAIAEAAQRLQSEDRHHPAYSDEWHDRPLVVVGGENRRPRLQPARKTGWNPEREAIFLETLTATANVSEAARAAGTTPMSAYRHRQRWTGFANEWAIALKIAIDTLDLKMLHLANERFENPRIFYTEPLIKPTFADCISLIAQHRKQMSGTVRRRWQRPPKPVEEIKAEIIRKARLLAQYGDRAKDMAGDLSDGIR